MAPLPCNSQLHILSIDIFDNLVNDMTSEKCKPYGKISKLAISSKYAIFASQIWTFENKYAPQTVMYIFS